MKHLVFFYSNFIFLILYLKAAAHCFSGRLKPKIYVLDGQNFTRSDNYIQVKYEKIIIHENFLEMDAEHFCTTNDIALVKLADDSVFDSSIPVPCLPPQHTDLPIESSCYISGKRV